jgi:hypothetical protein
MARSHACVDRVAVWHAAAVPRQVDVFEGEIAGFGTSSGTRFVIGSWARSPFGAFTDLMIETAAGVRTLVAPSDAVAQYVAATYSFDQIRITPVRAVRTRDRLTVTAEHLEIDLQIGARAPLGWLLRCVPSPLATSRRFATVIDPIARRVVRGVRTKGTAGGDRTETYGATDLHRITAVSGVLDGVDVGTLTDLLPPVRFGFSSAPPTPAIVSVTTKIAFGERAS